MAARLVEACASRARALPAWAWALAVGAASVALQLALAASTRGYVADQAIFLRWAEAVRTLGFARAYEAGGIDYPPVYLELVSAYAWAAHALGLSIRPGTLAAKLPGILIYAAFMPWVWRLSHGVRASRRRLAFAFYCLNPVLLFDTAVWGQVDVLDATLALGSVWLAAKRPFAAGAAFGLGLASKFEAIVVLPVLVAAGWAKPPRLPRIGAMAAGALVPFALSCLPLLPSGVLPMITSAYIHTTSEYPDLSLNAMNIWFYFLDSSPFQSDSARFVLGLTYKQVGLLLLAAGCAFALLYLARSRRSLVLRQMVAASFVALSFFMLATEMHERYIALAATLLSWLAASARRLVWVAWAIVTTGFWNLWVVCFGAVNAQQDAWMVYLNLAAYLGMAALMVQDMRRRPRSPRSRRTAEAAE
ncbi:glycosyltransferase 87 family protein [Alicyclobacillus vulcanalis]|uniref:Mannosyltransferase related to Gpi18 n=1 Tax=Alicyclobacillus vulcanalis TaxID=252246 RepID=A0A1N7JXA3_9BACL|nr:glycosyltransferase 87 family protein [Alicyclobacillus vulcanalis]SIS53979.1 Mannosyltransferase related to Gpi18 [Alicyclobacillus vulcanalis]